MLYFYVGFIPSSSASAEVHKSETWRLRNPTLFCRLAPVLPINGQENLQATDWLRASGNLHFMYLGTGTEVHKNRVLALTVPRLRRGLLN